MKKSVTRKLLLIGFGLLLGLVLAELAVRIHTAVDARHVPGKRYVDAPAAQGTPSTAGTIRMAILGGSTSNGSPFSNAMDATPGSGFNLLSMTRFLLENRHGAPAVEIDNYSGPNWSAETTIGHYFERPGPRPDVLVLYTGQNETTQYYSPNMVPPPALLSPLARLQSGNLLLRRMFTRQVAPADQRYTGKFFSDNIIPAYEREHNLASFRRYVERLIRHAEAEGILLVIVIPQSNCLFPPTRSVYRGPSGRKAEALRLFKQAWQARYIDNAPDRALALLEELRAFCSFADLYYELGELHYSRGDFAAALPYLRRARETDGFPVCITPAYRRVLRELVEEYGVPRVDMDEVIRQNLARPVPDYVSYLDDCHLHLDVHLELSREFIGVMRQNGFDGLDVPPEAPDITAAECSGHLGITPAVWRDALLWEISYHLNQVDYTFRKLCGLKRARSYIEMLVQQGPTAPDDLGEEMTAADRMIRTEKERMRKWVRHEGPMPIGASSKGDPPKGFGRRAEIETTQGDAMQASGEWELAVAHYRAALAIDPDFVRARSNLGATLGSLQQFEEAAQELERALALDPQHLSTRGNLGKVLLELGRFDEAIVHLREAARIAPRDAAVLRDYCTAAGKLAWRLATDPDPAARDGERAVELAEEVCRVAGYRALDAPDVLAAAYAETGRFEDAVAAATRALELARQYDSPLADTVARRLAEYEAGRPWREGAGTQ